MSRSTCSPAPRPSCSRRRCCTRSRRPPPRPRLPRSSPTSARPRRTHAGLPRMAARQRVPTRVHRPHRPALLSACGRQLPDLPPRRRGRSGHDGGAFHPPAKCMPPLRRGLPAPPLPWHRPPPRFARIPRRCPPLRLSHGPSPRPTSPHREPDASGCFKRERSDSRRRSRSPHPASHAASVALSSHSRPPPHSPRPAVCP